MGQSIKPKIWMRNFNCIQYYCLVCNHYNYCKDDIQEWIFEKYSNFFKSFKIAKSYDTSIESISLLVFLNKDENEANFNKNLFKEDSISQNSQNEEQNQEVLGQINQERFKYDDQYPYLPHIYEIELVKDVNNILEQHKKNLFYFFS